jgi:hypothetical protein
MADPAVRRDYTPREMRLVSEYAAITWPNGGYWTHKRLGPPITNSAGQYMTQDEAAAVGSVFRRWADLIAVEPTQLIVCEGKMIAQPGAVSQLELYMDLIATTPELEPYSDRQIVGRLLCAIPDPATTALAARHGITVAVFRPPWVDVYLAVLRRRENRAPTQLVYPDGSESA